MIKINREQAANCLMLSEKKKMVVRNFYLFIFFATEIPFKIATLKVLNGVGTEF